MVATRFAVAVHILLLLACRRESGPATSALIAGSVNTNPVVVRRITAMLSRAGLVRVRRGPGGAELMRAPGDITLADVWQAINPGRSAGLLPLHAAPNPECPIGAGVHAVLGEAFRNVDRAVLATLRDTNLAMLCAGLVAEG